MGFIVAEVSISSSHRLRQSALQAMPIVLGYLPVGFAYGILARSSGLPGSLAILMSLLVYAGSSQLIAVSLFAAQVSPYSIILTTFIVNLRHMLMSASLSPYLRRWKNSALAAFAFELTDETFALHSTRFAQGDTDPPDTFVINIIAQSAWVAGTVVGVMAGNVIRDVRPFGLDYALAAMFIALLVFQVKAKKYLWIALFSGALSTGLLILGFTQWNVILATVIAATVGLGVELWMKK